MNTRVEQSITSISRKNLRKKIHITIEFKTINRITFSAERCRLCTVVDRDGTENVT